MQRRLRICYNTFQTLMLRDDGQDLIEYALLVGLVALVAVSAVTQVGSTIKDVFWNVIAASIP